MRLFQKVAQDHQKAMVAGEEAAPKPVAPFRGINNWRRCALRMMLVLQAGSSAAILNYLQESRMEYEEQQGRKGRFCMKGLLSEEDGPKAPRAKKEPAVLKAMAKGAAMQPSKTGNYTLHMSMCTHPANKMAARANAHMTWLTCLDCGSRWKRTDEEVNQVRAAVAADSSGVVPPECKCGHLMVLRSDHQTEEKFFGCSQYPTCRFTSRLTKEQKDRVPLPAPPSPSQPATSRPAASTRAPPSSLSKDDWVHMAAGDSMSIDGDSQPMDILERALMAEQMAMQGMNPEAAVTIATRNLTEEGKARVLQQLQARQHMATSSGSGQPDLL